MNPYIFRKYDIRGVVKEDFTDQVVENLGKAYGTFIKEKGAESTAVSGDVRKSTPRLKKLFSKGVLSTGVDVVDIGILPTPANYYSMYKMDVDGAVQITGSHNPADMNGFKMSYNKKSIFGEDIQKIKKIIEEENFKVGEGTWSESSILEDYTQEIISNIELEKDIKIAVDSGNGAAGLVMPEVLEEVGCDVTPLYCEIDGSFPNHHPDPTVEEYIEDLIEEVKNGNYDCGIAFDGDGDRLGLVDEKGNIIWADYMMILFLDEIITDHESVIFDVKCSQALEDVIKEKGGQPLMWKTGHALIKEKMREEKAPFAGEMSGHICFADDYYGYDDAIYTALRLVQTLSRSTQKLSEIMKELPHYYSTPEMRLECSDDETKFKIAKKSEEYFKEKYDCIDVDGVRIKFGDGWGLVRASNTQPVIVTRFEAKTEERLEEIKNTILNQLKEFGDIKID